MLHQLQTYHGECYMLPPLQSAYRRHHRIATPLLTVVNDLLLAVKAHCSVMLVLLNLGALNGGEP